MKGPPEGDAAHGVAQFFHPLADLFPLMEGREFDELTDIDFDTLPKWLQR